VLLVDTDQVDRRQLVVFDHGAVSYEHGVCLAATSPAV
jgi:hypothetical protein